MKNAVFWEVIQCGSCKNRLSGERKASIIRVTRINELGTLAVICVLRLLVTAKFAPSSPITVFLIVEATLCSETSLLT
jgi:hypothetical protein